ASSPELEDLAATISERSDRPVRERQGHYCLLDSNADNSGPRASRDASDCFPDELSRSGSTANRSINTKPAFFSGSVSSSSPDTQRHRYEAMTQCLTSVTPCRWTSTASDLSSRKRTISTSASSPISSAISRLSSLRRLLPSSTRPPIPSSFPCSSCAPEP